jgi:hypothetical protein
MPGVHFNIVAMTDTSNLTLKPTSRRKLDITSLLVCLLYILLNQDDHAHIPLTNSCAGNTMFRRPVLGAAVVYGVSRLAARREVERQEQRNAEAQLSAERAAEKQRRDEEERDRGTQFAIDDAIAKEQSKNAGRC